MKRYSICLLIVLALALSGCGGKYITKSQEMYQGPNFSAEGITLPEYITVIRIRLNRTLDLADTAFWPDGRLIGPSSSWPFYLVSTEAKTLQDAKRLWAVRAETEDGPILLAYVLGRKEKAIGHYGFVGDHAGKRIYFLDGSGLYLPGWQDVPIADIGNDFPRIKEEDVMEARLGTPQYEQLMNLCSGFVNEAEKRWKLAKKVRDNYYFQNGIPLGSALDEDQLKTVKRNKTLKAKLTSLLTENWIGIFTFPVLTAETYGLSIFLAKIYQIPTKFWKADFNQPGYMDRQLTAIQGSAMIEHALNNYSPASFLSRRDIEDLRRILKIYRK